MIDDASMIQCMYYTTSLSLVSIEQTAYSSLLWFCILMANVSGFMSRAYCWVTDTLAVVGDVAGCPFNLLVYYRSCQ
jgi:hypothetical protein